MNKKRLLTVMGAVGTPSWKTIKAWQDEQTDLISIGGQPVASFTNTNAFGANNTLIIPSYAIAQDCYITTIKFRAAAIAPGTWKFKLFRHNGTNYEMVSEVSFTPTLPITNDETVTLSTPVLAQMGDIPGLYVPANNQVTRSSVNRQIAWRYVSGDITTNDAFTSSTVTATPCLECYGLPPYLAVTGDSIPAGANAGTPWVSKLYDNSSYLTNPGGNPAGEIMNSLRGIIGDGTILKYQNLALGSQTFAWVASTGIVQSVAVKPNTILIHCGVNDVNTARTWEDIATDLGTIRTAVASTIRLMIDEILPWTAGTDEQAATIRTWNASLAVWCASNNATLVRCHDEMGQVRAGTGEIDDLLTAYNQDDVHLTTAGVAKMAEIWKRYL